MRDLRWPLPGTDARLVEHLLGLEPNTLRGVERRRNGDFALQFKTQRVGYRWLRTLRIPQRRLFGYQQGVPHVSERDVHARRRANGRRFAIWLMCNVDVHAPVVHRAVHGDETAIDELREAILMLTAPDRVVLLWETGRLPAPLVRPRGVVVVNEKLSPLSVRVLAALPSNVGAVRWPTARQIGRRLDLEVGVVRSELSRLRTVGVVEDDGECPRAFARTHVGESVLERWAVAS
jgi:hypothetical protein